MKRTKKRSSHYKTRGSGNANAKTTEVDVREIRALAKRGAEQKWLAEKFGLSKTTVSRIVNRRSWRHVKP